jgi:hypothetical protein
MKERKMWKRRLRIRRGKFEKHGGRGKKRRKKEKEKERKKKRKER